MQTATHRGIAGDLRGGLSSAVVSLGILLPLGLLSFAALGPAAGAVGIPAAFVTAIVGSLVATIVGGADVPGSGPKSSTAIIFAGFVAVLASDPRLATARGFDVETLLLLTSLCVAVSGLLQVLFALLRFGSLVSFVPLPVVAGFMDGLALLIAIAQVETFLGLPHGAGASDVADGLGRVKVGGLVLGIATAALCWFLARRWPRLPWALAGIVTGTLAYALVATVWPGVALGPLLGVSAGHFPEPLALAKLASPAVTTLLDAHLPLLLTTAFVIALVGSMDALLSAAAVDARLNSRHDSNRLLLGMGLANLACAAFGGLPLATSSSVQLTAHRAGGRGRLSGIVSVLLLAVVMIAAGRWLGLVPVTVVAGVMLVVAFGMFDQWSRAPWRQLRAGSRDRDALWSLAIVVIVVRDHRRVRLRSGDRRRRPAFPRAVRRGAQPLARAQRGDRRDPRLAADLRRRARARAPRARRADPCGRARRRHLLRHCAAASRGDGGTRARLAPLHPRPAPRDDDRRVGRQRTRPARVAPLASRLAIAAGRARGGPAPCARVARVRRVRARGRPALVSRRRPRARGCRARIARRGGRAVAARRIAARTPRAAGRRSTPRSARSCGRCWRASSSPRTMCSSGAGSPETGSMSSRKARSASSRTSTRA